MMKYPEEGYLKRGLMRLYFPHTWDSFEGDANALKRVKNAADNFAKFRKEGVGLFLYGPNGTGKTLLTNLAFRQLYETGIKQVKIISMATLVDLRTASWADPEAKETFDSIYKTNVFLCIEDLGKESVGRSEASALATSTLDKILRYRVQSVLCTWFTSNVSPSELSGLYSPDIVSMLHEACMPVPVPGQDFRLLRKKRFTGL